MSILKKINTPATPPARMETEVSLSANPARDATHATAARAAEPSAAPGGLPFKLSEKSDTITIAYTQGNPLEFAEALAKAEKANQKATTNREPHARQTPVPVTGDGAEQIDSFKKGLLSVHGGFAVLGGKATFPKAIGKAVWDYLQKNLAALAGSHPELATRLSPKAPAPLGNVAEWKARMAASERPAPSAGARATAR